MVNHVAGPLGGEIQPLSPGGMPNHKKLCQSLRLKMGIETNILPWSSMRPATGSVVRQAFGHSWQSRLRMKQDSQVSCPDWFQMRCHHDAPAWPKPHEWEGLPLRLRGRLLRLVNLAALGSCHQAIVLVVPIHSLVPGTPAQLVDRNPATFDRQATHPVLLTGYGDLCDHRFNLPRPFGDFVPPRPSGFDESRKSA